MDASTASQWRFLAMVSSARDSLRAIRMTLWERSLTPTKEHLHVDRVQVDPNGYHMDPEGATTLLGIWIAISITKDHEVTSGVELLIEPDKWLVDAEVTALHPSEDGQIVLWRAPSNMGSGTDALEAALLSAVQQVVSTTLELDLTRTTAD